MKERLVLLRQGFKLWVAFLVGRVPNHQFRKMIYRYVFRMDIHPTASIHWRTRFFAPENVRIGRNSIIGNDCFLDGRESITIGENVNIAGEVHIYTVGHDPQDPNFSTKGGSVSVGKYAYVSTRSIILPNVTIGEGAVVAAGAVVTKAVAPYSIVAGIPAKQIGRRNRDLNYDLGFHMPFQ